MNTRAFLVHALSPLHAGVGHADDIVELPTARMKASGLPFVPGSSIKGVLRDDCDERTAAAGAPADHGGRTSDERVLATFGPPTDDASAHAGALIVGDARLLALPVRSFRGTFAWVSSPLLLALAKRDLMTAGGGLGATLPAPRNEAGRWALKTANSDCDYKGTLYLEDLDLPLRHSPEVDQWAAFLTHYVYPDEGKPETVFTRRFVVVDDDTMSFFCETALQIDARVRLDHDTRTVAQGALWLEESLPPESLLLGLLAADRSRRKSLPLSAEQILDFALSAEGATLQFGGHATIGRGRCRVVPVSQAARVSQ